MGPVGIQNATRPGAFLGDARGGVACELCLETTQQGHREVRLPKENGRHVLHARHMMAVIARGAALAPLRCPVADCGVRHTRRDAWEAAV